MQRDMDLVRKILLAIDAAPETVSSDELTEQLGGGLENEFLCYHLEMLTMQAGFLKGINVGSHDGDAWIDLYLTWAGHEFLDKIRDPEIWDQTKQVARKAGGFSLDLLAALAKGLLKKQVEKHTGIDLDFQ